MRITVCRAILAALLIGLNSPTSGEMPGGLQQRFATAKAEFDRRAYPQAIAALAPIVIDAERADDEPVLARALYYSGRSHYFLADYRKALPMMQRALAISRGENDKPFEAEVLRGIGRLHKQQGTYADGLRACEDAIAAYDALGDKREAGLTWMTVGAIRDLMGEFDPALAAYERARDAIGTARDNDYYTLHNEIAITYTNLARYEEALAAHRVALEGREKTGDPYLIGISHSNIGDVYFSFGQYERAIEHYLLCLQKCGATGERRSVAIALQKLASTAIALGNGKRALEYAQRELDLTRELGLEPLQAVALRHMGHAQRMLDDVAGSSASYEQSLSLARKTSARADETSALIALSKLGLERRDLARASELGEQALLAARGTRAPDLEIEARATLAEVALAKGDGESALIHLRQSVEVIDSVRGGVRTDSAKIGYFDTRQNVYHLLALTLAEGGRPKEALEVAEAARGRAFSDLLAAQRVALKPADVRTLDAIRGLEAKLRTAEKTQPVEASQDADLLVTRAAGQAALDGKRRALRAEQPELASLLAAEPPSVAAIVDLASRRNATLVEYLVTDRRLLIWVVAPTGQVVCQIVDVPREQLRAGVRELQEHMNSLRAGDLRADPRARTRLSALHGLLLAPVAQHLPRDPDALVYLIPHDALHLVPFAALLDTRGRYALERHTLIYSPAAAVLQYTAPKKGRVVSAARPHFLALADPTPPDDIVQPPLPGAREEVRLAANRFDPRHRLMLSGAQASEANLKRLGTAQTVLHLAVHGLVRDDRPWESALILAPGDGDDGWLKVPEIFGLDLYADLVVLSGCSTGHGKISGDGIVGLARAVIYAGTPSVVVSQWDVSDRSTAYLMDRFYAAMAQGRSKAAALRAAQLATLARHPHPALWAPFVLVGEP